MPLSVGVVGAGLSGLVCATRLMAMAPRGTLSVTVFEWGRGPGGRTARRRVEIEGGDGEVAFDHGAPFFSARTEAFRDGLLSRWASLGWAARWPAAGEDAWVGTPSNHAIAKGLVAELESLGGRCLFAEHVLSADYRDRSWHLRSANRAKKTTEEYLFDALVLSDKLLILDESAGVRNPYAILPREAWGPLAIPPSLESSGAVVLLLALRGTLCPPMPDVLRLADHPILELLVRDSAKPGRQPGRLRDGPEELELWVVHSTPSFAAKHLRGEALDDADAVLAAMRDALSELLLGRGCVPLSPAAVAFESLFAWDHARPTAVSQLEPTHLFDSGRHAGACGDWLCGSLGVDGVEAAVLSGEALAETLASALLAECEG